MRHESVTFVDDDRPFADPEELRFVAGLLDLRGNIFSFIRISGGKLGDVNVLDILMLEPRGDLRHGSRLS